MSKSFFDQSKELVQSAKNLLGTVSEKVQAGLKAAKEIAQGAIESIIKIDSMCFRSSLEEAATNACVGFKVNATIMKSRKIEIDTKGCLDVSFAKEIGKAIADKLYPGINLVRSGIDQAKQLFSKVDSEKKDVEAEIAKTQTEAAKDDDEDDDDEDEDEGKRRVILTPEEQYFKKLAYEELPRFTLRDGETMAAFGRNSPAMRISAMDPMERAEIPKADAVLNDLKRRDFISSK